MKRIYLDYAASTPVAPEVLAAMKPYLSEHFGNPSSIHREGQIARAAIDEARAAAASFLHCEPEEIIFTSGATEANNLALFGLIQDTRRNLEVNPPLHVIISAIEHRCVLNVAERLAQENIEITHVPVDSRGFVDPEEVIRALQENTILVSVMYANNEIGTIQPIREIAKAIAKVNESRSLQGTSYKLYFHTDAVQAALYLSCNVEKLGADLLSLSGHKIYGPKGIGALYVRKGTPLAPIFHGGTQEHNLRPGTENVAAIVGFGEAVKLIPSHKKNIERIRSLRDKLATSIRQNIPGIYITSSLEEGRGLPNILHIQIPGVPQEDLLISLDLAGIAASSGSACAAGIVEPSHVLSAVGIDEENQRHLATLRFSLGDYTTVEEIDHVAKMLPPLVQRLQKAALSNDSDKRVPEKAAPHQ
jgi:cysteine desulfurase